MNAPSTTSHEDAYQSADVTSCHSECTRNASGMTASKKVEEDLCMAYDKGKKAMTAFVMKRLTTNVIFFHDPIPKLKLPTFDSMPAFIS